MKHDFRDDELRRFLEAEFGFAIASFERLPGRSASLNFKAVRASDGFQFVVKCLPASHRERLTRWRANLKSLEGSKAVQELFADKNIEYANCLLLFLTFGEGVRKTPDRLTEDERVVLQADYAEFAKTMQRCANPHPPIDGLKWFEKCFARHGGWRRKLIERIVHWRLAGRTSFDRKSSVCVIHGDLHAGNLAFCDGRLSAVFDVEDLRLGYATEDWVRLFSSAYEHIPPVRILRRKKLLGQFASFVVSSGYSAEQWTMAVDLYLMLKISGFGFGKPGLLTALRILQKSHVYVVMRNLVKEALNA